MKAVLIGISVAALLVAILGWMYWTDMTAHQSSDDWAAWNRKIEIVWRVMPIGMGVSIVSGIASLFFAPRTRKGTMASMIAIGASLAVGAMMWVIVSNLAIR